MKQIASLLIVLCATWLPAQEPEVPSPVSLSGGLTLGGQLYGVSGIPARSVSPLWNLSGQTTLSVYGIQAPFSFTVGRQGRQANVPAFGQIGISPTWKGITLHAGYGSMVLSSYTLAGHPFLGAGLEGSAGKFRFAVMYGRLRKARSYVADDPQAYPPLFRRTGLGVKLGVGTDRSFVDLVWFRASDDAGSLSPAVPDSLVTPGQNTTIGLNSRLALSRTLSAFAEGAVSLYTRDVRSPEVTDDFPDWASRLFTPKWSSRANYAARGGLEFRNRALRVRATYERIMPEFETMGAFFFANDVENITLAPSFRLWGSRLMVNGSFGVQRNNLADNRTETTRRFIGRGSVLLRPSDHFSLSLAVVSLAVRQKDGNIELTDTIRTALVTTHYSLTPMWTWSDSVVARSLVISANIQELNDRNPFTREFTDMSTWFFQATYGFRPVRAGWGWSAGLTANRIFLASLTTDRLGAQAGVQRQFGPRLSVQAGGGWNLSTLDGKRDGSVTNLRADLRWSITGRTSLNLNTAVLHNHSVAYADFTEWQGGAYLQWSF